MLNTIASASFVTFYSFKGGVGRSMALINTAAILAGRGFRVLVLDLDLEAPGLSYLSPVPVQKSSERNEKQAFHLGFVDLMLDAKENAGDSDLFAFRAPELISKYTRQYNLPSDEREFTDGTLHIMPAGKLDEHYAQRFDSLNLRGLYQDGLGEPLIRAFKKKFSQAGLFDYVLVDSRTGFSDEAGICTRDLADYLMILSGLNRQNIEGTSEFLSALRVASKGAAKFQIILSPVPNGEDKLMEEREKVALRSFQSAWGAKVDLNLQIPYHPQLSLTEEPHIFRRRKGYLFDAYSAIEKKMLIVLGHDASTLRTKVKDALIFSNYGDALRHLRFLVRLPRGKSSLSTLAWELMSGISTSQHKPEGEVPQRKVSIETVSRASGGPEVLEYLIDHLQIDDNESFMDNFLDRLGICNANLADRLHRRLISKSPNNPDTLGSFANFLADIKEDFESANEAYRRALQIDPNHATNLGNYAIFLSTQRLDKSEANRYYEKAIAANPSQSGTVENYAIFLKNCGEYDRADEYYRRAIELNPKSATYHSNYASFLDEDLINFDEAQKQYELAIGLDSDDADILGNYANFFAKQSNITNAKRFYELALKANPNHAVNIGNYGVFLTNTLKDIPTAREHFARAINFSPNNINIVLNYAIMLSENTAEDDLADSYFRRAMEIDRANAETIVHYADFLVQRRNDVIAAKALYAEALKTQSANALLLASYALFMSNQNDLDEAMNFYDQALLMEPQNADIIGNYALLLEKHPSGAGIGKLMYERAVAADPSHGNNLSNFAQFLAKVGDVEAANIYFTRSIEADPTDALRHAYYADFLRFILQDDTRAKVKYEEALALDLNNSSINFRYGTFLATQCDNLERAKICYERSLSAQPNEQNALANYGQCLIGLELFLDAKVPLLKAVDCVEASNSALIAEICFSQWIVSKILNEDELRWSQGFKHSIMEGFERSSWNFDRILAVSKLRLSDVDALYATAMADAFLDAGKVGDLEAHEQWNQVASVPLKPQFPTE